jgi:4-amino-4-deoxy-L-arabinose transferase-like glycosyltransferase
VSAETLTVARPPQFLALPSPFPPGGKRFPSAKAFRRLALALLVAGLAFRLALFCLCHPLYEDEAYLTLNLVDRDYVGLTRQLDHFQVAPVLFLWGELTAYRLLGSSEWALRLLPLLAGLGSLGLFWRVARRAVNPMAAAVAVGLLAVSRWPLHMSCQVKPYSFDLLASLSLLAVAFHWLRRPDRVGWLALLALLAPVAVAASYPAVFVAGGVSVALLPTLWRRPGWPARLLFLAFNVLIVAAFYVCDVVIAREQLGSPGSAFHDYMTGYWKNGFPPEGPLAVIWWLVSSHVGPLMGYPYATGAGSGLLTFPLFALGAYLCWRARRRSFVLLCLAPFAITLLAAFLHRYPYGECARLSQHLAPLICLLAGVGVSGLVRRFVRTPAVRYRLAWQVCGLLALVGVAYLINWTCRPYRDEEDQWDRQLARDMLSLTAGGEPVVVLNAPGEVNSVALWYLRTQGGRVVWARQADGFRLPNPGDPGWVLCYSIGAPAPLADRIQATPAWNDGRLRRTKHLAFEWRPNHPAFPRYAEAWRVAPVGR